MTYGHGIDIVEISRIKKAIEETKGFKERVFTDKEIEYCEATSIQYQSYAARFAAKEAFLKALGTGLSRGISWKDIEILNEPLGKPYINLYAVAKDIFDEHGLKDIFVSISHTNDNAVASVMIEK